MLQLRHCTKCIQALVVLTCLWITAVTAKMSEISQNLLHKFISSTWLSNSSGWRANKAEVVQFDVENLCSHLCVCVSVHIYNIYLYVHWGVCISTWLHLCACKCWCVCCNIVKLQGSRLPSAFIANSSRPLCPSSSSSDFAVEKCAPMRWSDTVN